jgi:hypothetical protein
MFEGGRWIEPLVGRSVLEKQNLEHRETARAVLAEPAVLPSTPAPAAHGHDAASGEIGWRVSGIGLPVAMSLGFSGIGAAMIVDPGAGVLVHVFGAFVILVFGLNVVSLVGNAVRYPVALRIDETGIDIAQRGPIPWAAVRRCTIQTYNRTRTLAVWVGEPGESLARIRRQPWMTRRLRRRIRRAPFHSISLRVLDASIPEITAQLRRYGRVLGEGDFQPRLDGFYEAQEQGLRARFQLDGTVRLGAETGTWSAQDDGLKIETGEREQFATLNSDGLFLVSKSGLVRMRFVRDPG